MKILDVVKMNISSVTVSHRKSIFQMSPINIYEVKIEENILEFFTS
jgi:hypothetical protein